jgi:hypothetical protein
VRRARPSPAKPVAPAICFPQPRTLLAAGKRRPPWRRPRRASRSSSTRCRIHGLEAGARGRRTAADDVGGGRGRGGEKAAPLPGRRKGRWCELCHAATWSSAVGRCCGCRAALLEEVRNSSLGSRSFAPCKLLARRHVLDSPRGLQVAPVLCSIYDHVAAGAGGAAPWS